MLERHRYQLNKGETIFAIGVGVNKSYAQILNQFLVLVFLICFYTKRRNQK